MTISKPKTRKPTPVKPAPDDPTRIHLTTEEARTVIQLIANPPKTTAYARESAKLAAKHVVIRS